MPNGVANNMELTNLGQEIVGQPTNQETQFANSWFSAYPSYQNHSANRNDHNSFSSSLLSFNENTNVVSIS